MEVEEVFKTFGVFITAIPYAVVADVEQKNAVAVFLGQVAVVLVDSGEILTGCLDSGVVESRFGSLAEFLLPAAALTLPSYLGIAAAASLSLTL